MEGFTGENGGDSQTGILDEILLDLVESNGQRVHIVDETDAVLAKILQKGRFVKFGFRFHGTVLFRGGNGSVFHTAHHTGLGCFFLQSHPGKQISNSLADG